MSYEFSIYENNAPESFIGQVTATDADSSSLTYTIHNPPMEISSLFSVSPSEGKIYAQQSFDREQSDYYTFHLVASDGYHLSSPVKIRIEILDVNDEIPRFLFPNEQNDTLILDRRYWNRNNYICQIEIHDNDLTHTHTLLLIYHFDQLKNFDYLSKRSSVVQFDSHRFFLDEHARLFFNDSTLNEGVYYLAFKVHHSFPSLFQSRISCVRVFDLDRRWREILRWKIIEINRRWWIRKCSNRDETFRLSRFTSE